MLCLSSTMTGRRPYAPEPLFAGAHAGLGLTHQDADGATHSLSPLQAHSVGVPPSSGHPFRRNSYAQTSHWTTSLAGDGKLPSAELALGSGGVGDCQRDELHLYFPHNSYPSPPAQALSFLPLARDVALFATPDVDTYGGSHYPFPGIPFGHVDPTELERFPSRMDLDMPFAFPSTVDAPLISSLGNYNPALASARLELSVGASPPALALSPGGSSSGSSVHPFFSPPGAHQYLPTTAATVTRSTSLESGGRTTRSSSIVAKSVLPTTRALPKKSAPATRKASSTSKKSRSSSKKSSTPSVEDVLDSDTTKNKDYLERNRKAAVKCRQKKRERVEDLRIQARAVCLQNSELQRECEELLEELRGLRAVLERHGECGKEGNIRRYFEREENGGGIPKLLSQGGRELEIIYATPGKDFAPTLGKEDDCYDLYEKRERGEVTLGGTSRGLKLLELTRGRKMEP